MDPYAVAVMRRSAVVGHVPRRISAACALFLARDGTITCTVTGSKQYSADLPQGGLEVPCTLKFQGAPKVIAKMKKLVVSDIKKQSSTSQDKKTTLEDEQVSKKRKIAPEIVDVDDIQASQHYIHICICITHAHRTCKGCCTYNAFVVLSLFELHMQEIREWFDPTEPS